MHIEKKNKRPREKNINKIGSEDVRLRACIGFI